MADPAIISRGFSLWYGDFQALFDVDLTVPAGEVTAMIGPSGCGKSTFLRSVNRIVERVDGVRTQGSIAVHGFDVCAAGAELNQVRRKVGMVFQRPNPLPLSIRENVLFGLKLSAQRPSRAQRAEALERALTRVDLWQAVKDRLDQPATGLSLEEQQKLCIARLLPTRPEVLLMDEPCSALDPSGTAAVEELIWSLRGEYSILIVTHNMAQARRTSDSTVFMLMGRIVEHSPTAELFVAPRDGRTADYIEGRYG